MVSGTTTTTNSPDRTEKLGITLSESLLQKIDNKRGGIPRSRYIRRAIESYLKVKGGRIKNGN
jgi:metal-responsive CopG/Arc/MetJ family transcriptional regulator